MKITKFVIETFEIDTNVGGKGKITAQGALSHHGADGKPTTVGDGFGKVSMFDKQSASHDDLHNNIYMTSSVNIDDERFVYSGSLSAHREPSEGVHVRADGIFVSEIR